MIRALSILLMAIMALTGQTAALAEMSPDRKAVLITGASSGLGRVMAETMAANGYFVYAGARKDKDLEELTAIDNIQGVRLDVNKQDQIDAAVKTISEAGRGLYGLVNNAGVAVVQPLIDMLDAALAKQSGEVLQWSIVDRQNSPTLSVPRGTRLRELLVHLQGIDVL